MSIPVVGTFFATPLNIYTTAIFLWRRSRKRDQAAERPDRRAQRRAGALLGRRILESTWFAAIAAAILMLTPALSSTAAWRPITSMSSPSCSAGCCAGCRWSARSALASRRVHGAARSRAIRLSRRRITMPVCVGLTLAFLYLRGFRSPATFIIAIAGFLVAVFPFVLWRAASRAIRQADADAVWPAPTPVRASPAGLACIGITSARRSCFSPATRA